MQQAEPTQEYQSVKRFHKKGFTGHVVNDYRFQRSKPPIGTNKERFQARKEARKAAKYGNR